MQRRALTSEENTKYIWHTSSFGTFNGECRSTQAAIITYHKLGGWKKPKFIFSYFWSLDVQALCLRRSLFAQAAWSQPDPLPTPRHRNNSDFIPTSVAGCDMGLGPEVLGASPPNAPHGHVGHVDGPWICFSAPCCLELPSFMVASPGCDSVFIWLLPEA